MVLHLGWHGVLAPAAAVAEWIARLRPASVELARRACRFTAFADKAPRTRRIARRTLAAIGASPSALERQLAAAAARRRPPRRIDEARALEALRDVHRALTANGVAPFIVFGTLLGAVRQQGFIRGDSDVDLGIIGGERLDGLQPLLADSGCTVSRVLRRDGAAAKVTIHHPNGCKLDVKAFEPAADGSMTWHTQSGNIGFIKRFPGGFGLKPIEFLGITVNAPDRAEEFLEWQYGPDWRIPDPTYQMMTSGPLHGPEHREFCRTAGPKQILRVLAFGQTVKALGMARNMAALFPEDELWPRLVRALKAAPADPARQAGAEDRVGERSAR